MQYQKKNDGASGVKIYCGIMTIIVAITVFFILTQIKLFKLKKRVQGQSFRLKQNIVDKNMKEQNLQIPRFRNLYQLKYRDENQNSTAEVQSNWKDAFIYKFNILRIYIQNICMMIRIKFFNIYSQFQQHNMFRGNFNRQSLKPQVVTFQYVLDQINALDHRALSLLQKMVNPSQMNIFATAALVSLFSGLIREIPCELLDEKKLNWSLLNMFLNDVEKFLENLRKFKDFINKNQITSKNMQIANYWIQKYNEIQQDNQYSVSYAFIQITQMVIKLDKQINQRLPSSPARSLSASPSPKMNDNDDIDEIDELKSQAERMSVKDPVKPKGLKLQLVPNKPIQSTVGHKHTQSQQIKQIQPIHAPVIPKKK
ncbi:unnamed protein product [Paramecium octaurelia]|uniref:Transmembrane protein n=1 Tax=Paramecium octaurelia TaxID=43137 RepID=A0A8S1TWD5_PAROT|nr:unnamed protein product [Paramecium octaurelia]